MHLHLLSINHCALTQISLNFVVCFKDLSFFSDNYLMLTRNFKNTTMHLHLLSINHCALTQISLNFVVYFKDISFVSDNYLMLTRLQTIAKKILNSTHPPSWWTTVQPTWCHCGKSAEGGLTCLACSIPFLLITWQCKFQGIRKPHGSDYFFPEYSGPRGIYLFYFQCVRRVFSHTGKYVPWWQKKSIRLGLKNDRLTFTPAFVRTQLEAILARAMIGAGCVDTIMFTAAFAWFALVDIWNDT